MFSSHGSSSSLPLSTLSSPSSTSSSSPSLSQYPSTGSSSLYSPPVQSSPYSQSGLTVSTSGQLNSNGFVPIAKPLIQDLYDLSSSATTDSRYSSYPSVNIVFPFFPCFLFVFSGFYGLSLLLNCPRLSL